MIGDVGIGCISVSELTVLVIAPAGDGSVAEECAGVQCSCGDGGGGESVGSADVGWCVGAVVVSVSELTGLVVSPAGDGGVVENGTSVVIARGDVCGSAAGAEVDRFTGRIRVRS